MKMIAKLTLAGLVLALTSVAAQAGEVEVSGVHLCCGKCVKSANGALKGVQGVSDVQVDSKSKTVSFQASNDAAAKAGVKALAEAGFAGTAKHGDKKVALPSSGAKAGAKSNSFVLSGLHLCCGGCVKAASGAAKKVEGVASAKADPKAKSITITGDAVSVAKAVEALNEAGFFAKVEGTK